MVELAEEEGQTVGGGGVGGVGGFLRGGGTAFLGGGLEAFCDELLVDTARMIRLDFNSMDLLTVLELPL